MSDENKNEKDKQNDYLNQFIDESTSNINEMKSELSKMNEDFEEIKDTIPVSSNNLDYLNVDLSALPLGIFYKPGFVVNIRSAKVAEVQAYSVVDDRNLVDVTEKMNQMLSACVKVELPNGTRGSYKDIKDGDRLQLIFMIRELTFQSGNSLAKDITCEFCNHDFKIPFRATANATNPKTFTEYDFPEELERFFNKYDRVFEFDVDGILFKLAPPTIGLQETIYKHIEDTVKDKKKPNVSYLKIIPFMLHDRITISKKGIIAKEDEFKKFEMDTFQILNHAVDKMVFGLKGLKMNCPECGQEVHTDMTFPNGASSLFVVSNPFDYFN